MLDKANYIVVEGPIGAGKTSLAKRLAERLQAETLFEQAEFNPFLTRFYQQPERWAMATQVSFLFQRLDQLAGLGAVGEGRRVVADFLFDKDRLFAEQNLSEDELALYRRILSSEAIPAAKRSSPERGGTGEEPKDPPLEGEVAFA